MLYENMDAEIFQYEGRILKRKGVSYLGYTNSYVRFYVRGTSVSVRLTSNITADVNMAGLSVFLDEEKLPVNRLIVDEEDAWYELCILPDDKVHLGQ